MGKSVRSYTILIKMMVLDKNILIYVKCVKVRKRTQETKNVTKIVSDGSEFHQSSS